MQIYIILSLLPTSFWLFSPAIGWGFMSFYLQSFVEFGSWGGGGGGGDISIIVERLSL